MLTVVETPTFTEDASRIWSEEERGAFCSWLAANPDAGEVIPGSGGCRKVRWAVSGRGKRGGDEIWLLLIYTKNVTANIPAHLLRAIREAIENEEDR
jgi:hypothetical protein